VQKQDAMAVAALRVLKSALPADAELVLEDHPTGTLVRVSVPKTTALLLELRRAGTGATHGASEDVLPVVVLRSRRRSERERFRNEATSYIDLSGAVFLWAPGFYLDRSDLPPALNMERGKKGADPYADRGSRVLRALLTAPRAQWWSTQMLAKDADVDTATASRVVRELRRRELVRDESPGQGRRSSIWVPDALKLIEDWTRAYSWEDNPQLRLAAPVGAPRQFIARLAKLLSGTRWALSLQAGASELAPHAAFDIVHAYIDPARDLTQLAFEQEWEITASGRLCLMHPIYAESVWFRSRSVEGVPVVSPVQLVLDLWHYPVRGREQARYLIETVLQPIWDSDVESR